MIVAGLFIGAYYYVAPGLPQAAELREIKIAVPLQVYSRDGRLIAEIGEQKRTLVAYEDIPPLLVKAVLATEDEHFFEHPGVDYRGVIRGMLAELGIGPEVGGSTITQQVPRTLEVMKRAGLNSGFDRLVAKYKEWILAFRMEREFTKEEILELYLNTSFFGRRSVRRGDGRANLFRQVAGRAHDLRDRDPGRHSAASERLEPPRERRARDDAAWRTCCGACARRARSTSRKSRPLLRNPSSAGSSARRRSSRRATSRRWCERSSSSVFGLAAMTAGLKVTTTIDSRLQAASNRAIRATLMAYDERHGYRGPIARIELPAADADEGESPPLDPEALRTALDDYGPLLDYESAIVLAADDVSARLFFAAHGEQTVGLDAVEWAWRFISDDTTGPKPTTVAEVLATGDVVRFRRTAEGGWRLAQIPEAQGAFVSIDPLDGAIVALNGGFDFFLNNYNRATQAERQPGSSFKPFVYSAAFANGFTPATVVIDAPVDVGYQPTLERVWRPENFGGKYFGPSRLREALFESMNSVSIKMTQTIGVPVAVAHVKRFGFDGVAVPNDLSLALGAGGVPPVKLAAGYAAFANGGYKVTPYFIDRVVTADGEVLYESKPLICPECNTPRETPAPSEPKAELVSDITELYPKQRAAPRVISPQNSYLISDMLIDVVTHGSGNMARRELRRDDLAGKTGTTNDARDTWFVGFNANIVGAAWVGFDQFRPLGGNEQGGSTTIPMWIDFMREALGGTPERLPKRPPGIVEIRINPETGRIANDRTPNTIFEKFDIDHLPEREEQSSVDPGDSGGESHPARNPFN